MNMILYVAVVVLHTGYSLTAQLLKRNNLSEK